MNVVPDFVITNSHFERYKLIRNGMHPSKVRTIHNALIIPLPQNIQKTPRSTIHIAAIGRLVPVKGHRYFIEAAAYIKKTHKKVYFFIAGDGPLRSSLKQLRDDLGLTNDIEFIGFQRDLSQVYSSLDILVNPSVYESFGNTCLEAMAFEKPVVATRVGGVPEVVIEGDTGLLVPIQDPEKLAEAIIFLLDYPDTAHKMGQAGRERVKKQFTRNRAGNELEEVYETVLRKN